LYRAAVVPARFPDRYGPWALVAGASEGIGVAFARALAGRGMNLVLIARRKALLDAHAEELRGQYGIEVRCLDFDLGTPDLAARLSSAVADLDVGLAVYNAAYSPVGDFATVDLAALRHVVDVNVCGPLTLVRALVEPMIARRRGAFVLMSSLAGNQGTPKIAAYAASKAFNTVLAEGLWHELKGKGVDVIVCCAGAVRTPGYAATVGKDAFGTLDAEVVVEQTLRALGRGPRVIPGVVNRIANWVMSRLLPRRTAIGIMAGSTKDLSQGVAGKLPS
jgi:uncharacterized protein